MRTRPVALRRCRLLHTPVSTGWVCVREAKGGHTFAREGTGGHPGAAPKEAGPRVPYNHSHATSWCVFGRGENCTRFGAASGERGGRELMSAERRIHLSDLWPPGDLARLAVPMPIVCRSVGPIPWAGLHHVASLREASLSCSAS